MKTGKVIGLSKSKTHSFSKFNCEKLTLIEGVGVENDAHGGELVKHRYLVKNDPNRLNLRQVHLIHSELFDELKVKGFTVKNGELGENITTTGIDLLNLPKDTVLKIGNEVEIKITGLREPCSQIDDFQKGLMTAVLDHDENGNLIRKAGIMAIVIKGGEILSDDQIQIILPEKPFIKLDIV